KPLGELEQNIMDVVWKKRSATVRCVFEQLVKQRIIAYTTVMTTMDRLSKKGILKRSKIGKAYAYQSVQTEADLSLSTTKAMIDMLVRRYGDLAIAQFVDTVDQINAEKFAELKRLVNEHRGEH
ncbi:MAG: BlaI/MecI/CopY family transcriptional regulator, partial [Candidatus Kerfeldbacteria bacterium]|nr:BlaI/MecI/CopY family transcriptional regulator [Candidatus Kerfeldbacteria bacterium]